MRKERIVICDVCIYPVGGLQVFSRFGRNSCGGLFGPGFHGVLLVDWDPILPGHPAGCPVPGARCWSRQHLHFRSRVPGVSAVLHWESAALVHG